MFKPWCPENRRRDPPTKSRRSAAWNAGLDGAGYVPMLPATLQFLIVMIASAINDRLQRKLD
jgi:hypothetical protein